MSSSSQLTWPKVARRNSLRAWRERLVHADSKLLAVMVAGALVVIIIGAAVFIEMSRQFEALERQRYQTTHTLAVVNALDTLNDQVRRAQRAAGDYTRTASPPLKELFMQTRAQLPNLCAQLGALTGDSGRQQLTALQQQIEVQMRFTEKIVATFDSGNTKEATRLLLQSRVPIEATLSRVNDWRTRELAELGAGDALNKRQLTIARRAALTSLVVGLLMVLSLAWLLLRYMRRREQAERELRLASDLSRGMLQGLSQGVALYNMSGRLVLWNEGFSHIHGVPPERLRAGMSYEEIIRLSVPLSGLSVETEIANATKTWRRAIAGESSAVELKRIDGLVLQIVVRPISSHFYIVTLTDVTEIRRSEEKARDQATHLSAVMDNVPDAIVTINEQGRLESWSEGAQRLFGYHSEDIIGHDFQTLLEPEQQQRLDVHALMQDEAHVTSKRRELEALHKNGRSFPIDFVMSEMNIGGRRLFVSIMRDITERRVVERLKTEFVATVSHELRTPLTSIAGSLSLLAGGVAGELPDKAQRLLDIAHKNSERLAVLINDILDLEKAESGKLELKPQPLSLTALVVQSIEANRSYAQQFNVRFVLQTFANDPVVLVDEARIMQVLANFLSNAAKFSPSGGQVLIQIDQRNGTVRTSVHDDGPGVPDAFHDRIFSRFAQADASDSRQKGGTGLGLAIAKSLIERHGGRVGFDTGRSPVGGGQGASFWFELPVVHVQPQQAMRAGG